MSYNPATDFNALWRNIAGVLTAVEVPGLDYTVEALSRAGLFTLSVSATAPVVNQSTTAWLRAAVPSYSAEGVLQLWNSVTSAYAPATAALFFDLLQASTGQNGVSWWTSVGGPPLNTIGSNGDLAIRTDQPGGIYGPKALGAWPASPLPGTTTGFVSSDLDNAFGSTPGQLIYRDAAVWKALGIGAVDSVLTTLAGFPAWEGLSALLDLVFGSTQGDVLYRGAAAWAALPPGTNGQYLSSGGAAANPSWATAFPSGTTLLFYQAAAPPGWTKVTSLNDVGLRVVSGSTGGSSTAGSAFSTVFAQTVVANTTLTAAQVPTLTYSVNGGTPVYGSLSGALDGVGTGATIAMQGGVAAISVTANAGGGAHTHTVNLALAYADVILCSKN